MLCFLESEIPPLIIWSLPVRIYPGFSIVIASASFLMTTPLFDVKIHVRRISFLSSLCQQNHYVCKNHYVCRKGLKVFFCRNVQSFAVSVLSAFSRSSSRNKSLSCFVVGKIVSVAVCAASVLVMRFVYDSGACLKRTIQNLKRDTPREQVSLQKF